MSKTTKIRKVEREHLPYGKFKYIVTFNCDILEFKTRKYNINKSKGILKKYTSSSQKRRASKKKNYFLSILGTFRHRLLKTTYLDLDKFVESFEDTIIGKYRISFNVRKTLPLRVFLTDYEDITYLFFNYRKHIGRVIEIITKPT